MKGAIVKTRRRRRKERERAGREGRKKSWSDIRGSRYNRKSGQGFSKRKGREGGPTLILRDGKIVL